MNEGENGLGERQPVKRGGRFDTVDIDGVRVREFRLAQHMTQAELIQESQAVSRSYLSGIEKHGRFRVSRKTGGALARALGVDLSELQLDDEPKRVPEINPLDQLSKFLGVFQRHLVDLSQDVSNIQGVLRQINSQEIPDILGKDTTSGLDLATRLNLPGDDIDPAVLNISIGLVVKEWRVAKGLTNGQLAKASGPPIKQNYLSMLESGKVLNPGAPHLTAVASGLGIRVVDLVLRRMPPKTEVDPNT